MKVKDNFISKHVLDNDIIIDKTGSNKNLIKLNETASFMFEKLKEGISLENLIEKMAEKYDVNKDVLENDVKEFINKLKELNIIEE